MKYSWTWKHNQRNKYFRVWPLEVCWSPNLERLGLDSMFGNILLESGMQVLNISGIDHVTDT